MTQLPNDLRSYALCAMLQGWPTFLWMVPNLKLSLLTPYLCPEDVTPQFRVKLDQWNLFGKTNIISSLLLG